MNDLQIWSKILSPDEELKYSFSVGDRYVFINLFFWIAFSIILIPLLFGFLLLPIVIFYYGYYLKNANYFAFTNKRVLLYQGLFSKNLTSIDYSKITDIHIVDPFFERVIFNTGNLILNTAGSPFAEITLAHVENPYSIKQKLESLKEGK